MTKVVDVTLSDGRQVQVREPGRGDISSFMAALPAMELFGDIATFSQKIKDGVYMSAPKIPEALLINLDQLLGELSGLPTKEVTGLNMLDWFALFTAFGELVPANFTTSVKRSN